MAAIETDRTRTVVWKRWGCQLVSRRSAVAEVIFQSLVPRPEGTAVCVWNQELAGIRGYLVVKSAHSSQVRSTKGWQQTPGQPCDCSWKGGVSTNNSQAVHPTIMGVQRVLRMQGSRTTGHLYLIPITLISIYYQGMEVWDRISFLSSCVKTLSSDCRK